MRTEITGCRPGAAEDSKDSPLAAI